ncbi:MAG: hypothetical protein HYU66_09935 [Armatimonadetes bacterium]|nr:hypothetical protein [Armatimonadota bacterium]
MLEIRPYQLLCLVCQAGGAGLDGARAARLEEILSALRRDPFQPVRLRCNVDSVYAWQNPGTAEDTPEGALFNERRDLAILQRLGLVPGDTRPGWELLQRVYARIGSPADICTYGASGGCDRALCGALEAGVSAGLATLLPGRPAEDRAAAKVASAGEVERAGRLFIRPHHLMCITCFHGGREAPEPIAEDNLCEVWDAIRRNPEIPVTLVRGCCQICPPCSCYDPPTNQCVRNNAMALRDQLKDLTVLSRLGLGYGDTLPARELYQRLFAAVPSTRDVCAYGDGEVRGWEWTICREPEGSTAYVAARRCGLGIPELDGGT